VPVRYLRVPNKLPTSAEAETEAKAKSSDLPRPSWLYQPYLGLSGKLLLSGLNKATPDGRWKGGCHMWVELTGQLFAVCSVLCFQDWNNTSITLTITSMHPIVIHCIVVHAYYMIFLFIILIKNCQKLHVHHSRCSQLSLRAKWLPLKCRNKQAAGTLNKCCHYAYHMYIYYI
jgi:hypothetical protein